MNLRYINGILTNYKPYKTELSKSEIITFTIELTSLACTLAIVTLLAIALQ